MNKEKMLMLESVGEYLRRFGRLTENEKRILEAISFVDRKFFMPAGKENLAYLDEAIGIEEGQTISQPSTVARMLSLLQLKETDNVLEIGTGSCWNACLIARILGKGKCRGKITSLELHDKLIMKAKQRQKKLKIKNLEIKKEDFRKVKEKFDKIIFTAGITSEKEKIIEELAQEKLNKNGILVCPFQAGPLIIITKDKKGKLTKTYTTEEYVFVPLVLS